MIGTESEHVAARRSTAMLQKAGHGEADVWAEFENQRGPNFFNNVSIAQDGGFSEVGDLWYPMRWVTAVVTIFFLVSNFYYVVSEDARIIAEADKPRMGLLGQAIMQNVVDLYGHLTGNATVKVPGDKLIASVELLLGVVVVLYVLHLSILSFTSRSEQRRWFAVEKIWWSLVPDMYTFSAMRLLHLVSPQVLSADVVHVMNAGWKKVVTFIVTRSLCLIVGFDAFLLKCQESKHFIQDNDSFDFHTAMGGLIFLKQVLGIVQLGMFVRDRLFIFIFAGEDSNMSMRETSLKRVWNAMLVREIWRTYSTTKFVVIMLSFDDTDFQRLVLNEKDPLRRGQTSVPSGSTTSSEDEESGFNEDYRLAE
mmetsp:Transcript_68404/g.211932  ORF Transcript_68404/g.211932 Transcript_68404/m.211932 type:complete len:365 (-) Transcript_68404:36-1130(-)